MQEVKLTQYSHGAGCGCKIAPGVLDRILGELGAQADDPRLLVGHGARDDAAVYDLGDGTAAVSTTDFFMPIVDDPHSFGRIAAANAISDIYAMGGSPLMAIAILGWPVDKLDPEVAGRVLEGGRSICAEAGIPLAGGHSIDSPEPIFGLAVTGRVEIDRLKRNGGAEVGDMLFLSKPLGVGMVTTAQKKGMVQPVHLEAAAHNMMRLNKVGAALGQVDGVHAMTDVTGFGLAGHGLEMARATQVELVFHASALPTLDRPALEQYHATGCIPGGTRRNFASYGADLRMDTVSEFERDLLCDPQTSGGLLIAAAPRAVAEVCALLDAEQCHPEPIGEVQSGSGQVLLIP
jgi:selenide,water dikinase